MGFARDKMSGEERAVIAAGLFTVRRDEKNRCEQIGLCPIHGEDNPSFSYNWEKDAYHCLSCGASGDLVDLWCKVNGYADSKEGFKEFCRAHTIDLDGSSTTPAARAAKKKPPAVKKPAPVIPESVWKQMQLLPESFIKRLQEIRGWSRQTISNLDLRLQTVYQGKDGSIVTARQADRIAIPVRNDRADLLNIRLYKPGSKTRKITSWGKGYGSAQLYPPGPLLKPDGPVILCEGEPDTICAISRGFNAITQTSKLVNWPGSHLRHFAERDIIIAYDGDQAGQTYAVKAAACLHPVAKSVQLLTWPDYMGKNGDGSWPDKHGQDLTDFFVRHGGTDDDFKKLLDQAEPYTPDPAAEKAEKTKKAMPKPLGGDEFFHLNANGRWTYKPRWLANRLCNDMRLLYEPNTSRMYRYSTTFWEDFQEEHLEAAAINYLGDESTSSRCSDAAKQARLLSILPHGREVNDSGMMCIENGMLDISDIKSGNVNLEPHDPDHFATYQLPISYLDETEKKCERWLECLQETIQTKEVIMQAQEFAGYCLTRETRYAKALLLLGPGSDGKTTFINVIEQLVGERNIASVALRDLEDQFYRSGIYNKLLCTSTEISKDYFNSQYFKAIVTGDTISAAHKNKDPFEFKPYCKFIFAGNDLPRSRDNSDGYFRRLLPIRFKRQFFGADEDKHLDEKLRSEMSEIFKWALAGLHRLLRQDGFTESEETEALIQEYRLDNNPVMAFISLKCHLGEAFEVDKDGLYRKYREFCDQYNYRALNRTHFFRELTTAQKNLRQYRPSVDGKRTCMLQGIGLIAEDI